MAFYLVKHKDNFTLPSFTFTLQLFQISSDNDLRMSK
jgi:hypothetical protein